MPHYRGDFSFQKFNVTFDSKSIGSAVYVGLTVVRDIQTDRQTTLLHL